MPSQPLARVTDPEALNRATGPRAEIRIGVPQIWLEDGADIELLVPRRLPCARCAGGGCDGCERSGVWRAPADEQRRLVRVSWPARHAKGVKLRLVRPFSDCVIEQLIVVVEPAAAPSAGVHKLTRLAETERVRMPLSGRNALAMAALMVAAVLLLLALL